MLCERVRKRGLGVFRVGGEQTRATGRRGARPTSVGRGRVGSEHLELAARRADVSDPPVRLDEVRCPPHQAGLPYAATRHARRHPFQMIDRGARTITTELEETERRARPHDDRLGAGCRGGRERSAAVPLGVVVEPETGLDARLHGVQPRADPGQAERVLPHLGRRGDERLAPPTASPVELGADRERDRKEEEPAGVACRVAPARRGAVRLAPSSRA